MMSWLVLACCGFLVAGNHNKLGENKNSKDMVEESLPKKPFWADSELLEQRNNEEMVEDSLPPDRSQTYIGAGSSPDVRSFHTGEWVFHVDFPTPNLGPE